MNQVGSSSQDETRENCQSRAKSSTKNTAKWGAERSWSTGLGAWIRPKKNMIWSKSWADSSSRSPFGSDQSRSLGNIGSLWAGSCPKIWPLVDRFPYCIGYHNPQSIQCGSISSHIILLVSVNQGSFNVSIAEFSLYPSVNGWSLAIDISMGFPLRKWATFMAGVPCLSTMGCFQEIWNILVIGLV